MFANLSAGQWITLTLLVVILVLAAVVLVWLSVGLFQALFDDADLCVTVQMPNNFKVGDAIEAGPLFWAQDHSNYYYFEIDPNGKVALERKVKGKWVTVLGWRQIPTAKTGAGAKNTLRVTTTGNTITLYLDDMKIASVKGQQPDGGGQIGLRADSEKDKRDTWKFMNLKVTDVAPAG